MVPFMKSFHHFKLRCDLTLKRGRERLLPFFPFCILDSELISINSLFFTNLFCANITVKTRSNSTKKLHWLFTKEIIALITSPTSLSQLVFHPRPTVIYDLVFLSSVVSFIKKFPLLSQTLLFIKKHFINNCRFSVFM